MKELNDNEIRIIGVDQPTSPPERQPAPQFGRPRWIWVVVAVVVVLLAALLWWCSSNVNSIPEEVYFDSTTVVEDAVQPVKPEAQVADTLVGVTLRDTMVNDIPLAIYTPHNLHASLHVGKLPEQASDTVLMALQAADLRADNMEIVSAFVLRGELLSRGTAKQGFCAIIGGSITLGVDEATPYFEQAIAKGGDFFRQYPLVDGGKLVENRIKNKAIRRALVALGDHVVVVATRTRESLHDFSQSLVDIGATTAINLVGAKMSSGWINVGDSIVTADPELAKYGSVWPDNINYIIWTK